MKQNWAEDQEGRREDSYLFAEASTLAKEFVKPPDIIIQPDTSEQKRIHLIKYFAEMMDETIIDWGEIDEDDYSPLVYSGAVAIGLSDLATALQMLADEDLQVTHRNYIALITVLGKDLLDRAQEHFTEWAKDDDPVHVRDMQLVRNTTQEFEKVSQQLALDVAALRDRPLG